MKPSVKLLAYLACAALAVLVVILALLSFRSLMGEYGGETVLPALSLPFPVLLILCCFPLLSILLAAFLTVRALSRIRKKEAELAENEEDEA